MQIAFPLLTQSEPVLELAQREPELTTTMRRARFILAAGLRSIEVGAATLLLCVPRPICLLLLALSLLCAACAWIVTYPSRIQVAISAGRKQIQHRYLVLQGDKLLIGLFTLGIFFDSALRYDTWIFDWPVMLASAGGLVFAVRYCIGRYRYQRLLTTTERRKLIHAQQQQLGIDFLAWSLVVGGEAFFGVITPNLRAWQFSQAMWTQNAALSICLLWLLANVLKAVETLYISLQRQAIIPGEEKR